MAQDISKFPGLTSLLAQIEAVNLGDMKLYEPLTPARAPENEQFALPVELQKLYILKVLLEEKVRSDHNALVFPRSTPPVPPSDSRLDLMAMEEAELELVKVWLELEIWRKFKALRGDKKLRLRRGWVIESAKWEASNTGHQTRQDEMRKACKYLPTM